SRFQWIAAFLAFDPSLESCFVDWKIDNLRPAHQSTECFHHLGKGGKDDLIHRFWLSLTGVCVEVGPASVRTKHKHARLWNLSIRRDPRLGNQVRSLVATAA